MRQDEIFKLLLSVLLIENENENARCGHGHFSSLNEILLVSLLLNSNGDDRNDCCRDREQRFERNNRNERERETSF